MIGSIESGAAAVKGQDYAAQVLLQWFINEQVEEEAWTDEMVERVEAAPWQRSPGGWPRRPAGSLLDLVHLAGHVPAQIRGDE